MATQKKRKAPRASFVITVTAAASALTLAALPGCGSTVSGSCPEAEPSYGSSCGEAGQSCTYGDDGCGNPIEYACEDGAWGYGDSVSTCNPPPPPLCPDTIPSYGAACDVVGSLCEYADSCGLTSSATCSSDLTWEVTHVSCNPPPCPPEAPVPGTACVQPWGECIYTVDDGCGTTEAQAECVNGLWQFSVPICNPPPPDYCYSLTTEAECGAAASLCRWLVPGCATPGTSPPPLAQAGCHPSFDCGTSAECLAGATCAEVITDPCYNLDCDACGASSKLCVAP